MASVVFAAVIATVMFFLFERTRGFGVIGVFALIAINPILFAVVFVIVGGLYLFLIHKWRKRNENKLHYERHRSRTRH